MFVEIITIIGHQQLLRYLKGNNDDNKVVNFMLIEYL